MSTDYYTSDYSETSTPSHCSRRELGQELQGRVSSNDPTVFQHLKIPLTAKSSVDAIYENITNSAVSAFEEIATLVAEANNAYGHPNHRDERDMCDPLVHFITIHAFSLLIILSEHTFPGHAD